MSAELTAEPLGGRKASVATHVIRRNRRPDWRRIKSLRSYTIDDIARALSVHPNAVRFWIKKCGLPVFSDQRPHLVQGAHVVSFLKERRAARRRKCGPGQFFCLRCRQAQTPAGNMVDFHPIDSTRGALVGMCPTCEMLMRRFVSRARLSAVASQFSMQISHQQESIRDTVTPSLNCYFNESD